MSLAIVQQRISLAIRTKKREENLGVRAAAKECGINASTLSRLERGAYSTLPDATTLNKLGEWLGIPVSKLLGGETSTVLEDGALPEIVEVHLRANKNLAPETAKALADMFRALYEQAMKPAK